MKNDDDTYTLVLTKKEHKLVFQALELAYTVASYTKLGATWRAQEIWETWTKHFPPQACPFISGDEGVL